MTPPPVQQPQPELLPSAPLPEDVADAIEELCAAEFWSGQQMAQFGPEGCDDTLPAKNRLVLAIRSSLAPQQQPVGGEVSPEVQGRIQEIRERIMALEPVNIVGAADMVKLPQYDNPRRFTPVHRKDLLDLLGRNLNP